MIPLMDRALDGIEDSYGREPNYSSEKRGHELSAFYILRRLPPGKPQPKLETNRVVFFLLAAIIVAIR
jgi:hypothetical protein